MDKKSFFITIRKRTPKKYVKNHSNLLEKKEKNTELKKEYINNDIQENHIKYEYAEYSDKNHHMIGFNFRQIKKHGKDQKNKKIDLKSKMKILKLSQVDKVHKKSPIEEINTHKHIVTIGLFNFNKKHANKNTSNNKHNKVNFIKENSLDKENNKNIQEEILNKIIFDHNDDKNYSDAVINNNKEENIDTYKNNKTDILFNVNYNEEVKYEITKVIDINEDNRITTVRIGIFKDKKLNGIGKEIIIDIKNGKTKIFEGTFKDGKLNGNCISAIVNHNDKSLSILKGIFSLGEFINGTENIINDIEYDANIFKNKLETKEFSSIDEINNISYINKIKNLNFDNYNDTSDKNNIKKEEFENDIPINSETIDKLNLEEINDDNLSDDKSLSKKLEEANEVDNNIEEEVDNLKKKIEKINKLSVKKVNIKNKKEVISQENMSKNENNDSSLIMTKTKPEKALYSIIYNNNGIMEKIEYFYDKSIHEKYIISINYLGINKALNMNKIDNLESLKDFIVVACNDKIIEDFDIKIIRECAAHQIQIKLEDNDETTNKNRNIGCDRGLQNIIVLAGIKDIDTLKKIRFEMKKNSPSWPENIGENIEFLLNNVGLTKSKDQTDNQELTSIYNLNTDYISLSTAIAAIHYAVNMVIDLKKLRNDNKNESSIYIYDPSGKLKDNKNEKFFAKSEKDYSILSNYKENVSTFWYQACCSTLVIAENKNIIDKIDDVIKKGEISKDSNISSESFETLQSLKLRELADYIGTSKYIKTLLSK